MHICLVSQEYPPETAHGGIGTQTYVKAHGMAKLGHAVTVLSHSIDAQRRAYSDADVHVVRIPSADARLPIATEPARWLSYSLEVAAEISRLHAARPIDVLDFPEWGGEGYVHLLNETSWNKIPTVVHLHGPLVMFANRLGWPDLDSEFYVTGTMMEGACLRLADAIISSSDCSADWCAQHYGVSRERIITVHTGVDRRVFRPMSVVKSRRPTIVFVGRVAANKGVEALLEAALDLAGDIPDLRLQIVGGGDEGLSRKLADRAAAAGHADLLELSGFRRREDLPEILSRAHVFAAPSIYEGGPGFVYLEAMACGLPVVACSGSGASEVVRHGQNGLLVPPGQVGELAAALRRLLVDRKLRERLSAGGLEMVAEEADSDKCLRRFEAIYTAVAEGRWGGP